MDKSLPKKSPTLRSLNEASSVRPSSPCRAVRRAVAVAVGVVAEVVEMTILALATHTFKAGSRESGAEPNKGQNTFPLRNGNQGGSVRAQ